MKSHGPAFEKIIPRLKDGEIILHPESIEFKRLSDGISTHFSVESQFYLRCFMNACTVREIVLEQYKKGQRVNFALLKKTLVRLYQTDNLVNASDFSWALEYSDGPPQRKGHLFEPFLEINIDDEPLLLQAMIYLLPLGLIATTFKVFLLPNVPSLALLLFPQAFMNVKGVFSAIASTLLNSRPPHLSLQFSALGVYVKPASGQKVGLTLFEYAVHAAAITLLICASFIYFQASANPIFREFGPLLTLLVACGLLSPIQNTEVAYLRYFLLKTRAELDQLKATVISAFYFTSVTVYTAMALKFCTDSVVGSVNLYTSWAQNAPDRTLATVFHGALFLAAIAILFDLFDEGEILLDSKRWPKAPTFRSLLRELGRRRAKNRNFAEIIAAIPIFKGLPHETLFQMTKTARFMKYRPGFKIFKEGETSTDLFLVTEGRVGIFKKGLDGKKHRIIEVAEGSLFGEGGFLLNRPRSGDAYALSKVSLLKVKRPLSFEKGDASHVQKLEEFQKKIWSYQALANSAIFKDSPAELVMQIVAHGEVVELPENRTVIQKGDLPNALWIIIQGRCQAVVNEKMVRSLGVKEVIGEIGLLWNVRRTSTVLTTAPTILLRVDAPQVWEVLSTNLNLAVTLQEIGERRLQTQSAA